MNPDTGRKTLTKNRTCSIDNSAKHKYIRTTDLDAASAAHQPQRIPNIRNVPSISKYPNAGVES